MQQEVCCPAYGLIVGTPWPHHHLPVACAGAPFLGRYPQIQPSS